MDSCWFAVDADGFVAEFDTGEGGALPSAAGAGGEAANFDHEALREWVLVRRLAAGDLPPDDPHGVRLPPTYPVTVIAELEPDPLQGGTYREEPPRRYAAEALLAAFEPVVLHEQGPRVVATRRPLPPERVGEVERHPGVKRLITRDEFYELEEAREGSGGGARGGRTGPYRYSNPDYVPGNYTRDLAPAEPLRLDDLPAALREPVGRLALPVRFAETAELKLDDFMTIADVAIYADVNLRGEPLPATRAQAAAGRHPLLLFFLISIFVGLMLLWLLK
jgi:hypothetical protein